MKKLFIYDGIQFEKDQPYYDEKIIIYAFILDMHNHMLLHMQEMSILEFFMMIGLKKLFL
jgi:hypothetical protein